MIIRAKPTPETTVFYTPDEFGLQFGKVVHAAGGKISRHRHKPFLRRIAGGQEILVVEKGRMVLDVYADGRTLHSSHEMEQGDVAVLAAGGHGFRFLEDTVLLEIKQGPYCGNADKELF
jgi:quercetin dioxygenase-like cupin family protein